MPVDGSLGHTLAQQPAHDPVLNQARHPDVVGVLDVHTLERQQEEVGRCGVVGPMRLVAKQPMKPGISRLVDFVGV
jgi:hypothetical protein